jgi:alkylation response protein AidB-like acyl-CoA dehydrogenase
MQLSFDADVEAFRSEFVAFLDEHLPDESEALQRSQSSSDIPRWARTWQRLLFDNGWLLPGNPPEFGGRDATVLLSRCSSCSNPKPCRPRPSMCSLTGRMSRDRR